MKVIISQCDCACGCTSDFKIETGKRGRRPTRCEPCRAGQCKPVKITTPNTCGTCGGEFPRTRGIQPKNCPDCRLLRMQSKADQPKPDNVCHRCNMVFPHTGKKGRQPHHCPTCQDELRQQEPSAQSLHRKGKRRKSVTGEEITPLAGADLWLAIEDKLRVRGQLLSQQ